MKLNFATRRRDGFKFKGGSYLVGSDRVKFINLASNFKITQIKQSRKTMKILKFLFLLPFIAIGAQALEQKVVMKPEASLKTGFTT